jgi:hypothetical protein
VARADRKTGEIAEVNLDDPNVFVKEAQGLDFVPTSWDELEAAFADTGGILTFEGSPWKVIDKDTLLGVPFMIADVRLWHSSKFDNDAVSVQLLTKEPLPGDDRPMYVINDGSTGLMQQVLGMIQRSGRKSGISCPNGLRKSEYEVEVSDPFEPDKAPKKIAATTYYVA